MLTETNRRPKLTLATVNSVIRKSQPNGGFVRPSGNVPPYGQKVFLLKAFRNTMSEVNIPKGIVGRVAERLQWSAFEHASWNSSPQRCLVDLGERGTHLIPADFLVLDEE